MWLHYALALWAVGASVVLLVLYAYGEQDAETSVDG
ncbi:hypothetical protein SAMN05216559_1650 [Halomicrobium zhouii]|uniref:Uncharacterized protein n=1 Tax=Halomicrobium zhouii TaxID=767519 RepID=A0A1I6KZE4_9EURY|nr:hypothetical protein SAMN05216559_1650 [Halomicrobium zhouii]